VKRSRGMDRIAETFALRDSVLDHIGRVPQAAEKIFEAVRSEWGGDLCERRLYRALLWLISRAKVLRVGREGIRTYHFCLYALAPGGGCESEIDRISRERLILVEERCCYGCWRHVALVRVKRVQLRYCRECWYEQRRRNRLLVAQRLREAQMPVQPSQEAVAP